MGCSSVRGKLSVCVHVYHEYVGVNMFWQTDNSFDHILSFAFHTPNTQTELRKVANWVLPSPRFLSPNNVTRLAGQPIIPLALSDVIRVEITSALAILLHIRKSGGHGVSTLVWAAAQQRTGSQTGFRKWNKIIYFFQLFWEICIKINWLWYGSKEFPIHCNGGWGKKSLGLKRQDWNYR